MKRDASEVIAEMRARATFLRDRGDDFANVEAEKMDDWANRLAAAEPADAGRDAYELLRRAWRILSIDAPNDKTTDDIEAFLTRPPSEAAAADVVRRDDNGLLDEIVGNGYYHLEQMHSGHWSLRLGRHLIGLHSTRAVQAVLIENDLPLASQQAVKP